MLSLRRYVTDLLIDKSLIVASMFSLRLLSLGVSSLTSAAMMFVAPTRSIGHVRLAEKLACIGISTHHRLKTAEDGRANKQAANMKLAIDVVFFVALLIAKLNDDDERDIPWYKNKRDNLGSAISK
jgi:uncharacterized protein (DUF2384 family)